MYETSKRFGLRFEEKIHTENGQNRISTLDPHPDYVAMHELARHTIHSSEMIAAAAETVANLIQEHELFVNDNASLVLSTTLNKQAMRQLRSHIALLKSLHLRSKALEDRLQNEINLVRIAMRVEILIIIA